MEITPDPTPDRAPDPHPARPVPGLDGMVPIEVARAWQVEVMTRRINPATAMYIATRRHCQAQAQAIREEAGQNLAALRAWTEVAERHQAAARRAEARADQAEGRLRYALATIGRLRSVVRRSQSRRLLAHLRRARAGDWVGVGLALGVALTLAAVWLRGGL